MTATVITTDLPLKVFTKGKVRDVYDLGDELLMVASDRISAFDVVMPTPIPDKGKILTQMSIFWFEVLKGVIPHHLITADVNDLPKNLSDYHEILSGRFMLVKKTKKFPIECVVRGYMAGSGWKEYQANGKICGIPLPPGLKESERFTEPLFTPATKEEGGKHDENISFEEMCSRVGKVFSQKLKDLSIRVYKEGTEYAESRGFVLADTKFEFGLLKDEIILIDEVLTSDSSRFWDKKSWSPGKAQEPFDKQYLRDYLESLKWNKKPPAPTLPEEVVQQTRARYIEAYERITNKKFNS